MINEAYTTIRLSAANIGDLAKLHKTAYGKILLTNFFTRKYATAYTGAESIGFIAYDQQMVPVAYYGVIPCFLVNNGKTILAAQSADTMTHPDHRHKGLFIQLAMLTYKLCKSTGIKLVFGFPNQNSLPGFINKLGWRNTETMDCFIIPVKTLPFEKLSHKAGLLKRMYGRYTRFVLKKYKMPYNKISSSVFNENLEGVVRDRNYLRYKTYSNTCVLNIEMVTFWIKISNDLMIGDVTGLTNSNFEKAINQLLSISRKLGIKQIQFQTSPSTQLHRLFDERYQAIPAFPVIFKDLGSGIPNGKMKFTLADIDIF
jgi:hypothetical protein